MNEKLKLLLGKGVTMQLATAEGDQPWVSTVYYTVDEKLTIYWVSSIKRRHSIELAINEQVGASIVISDDPNGDRVGIQLSGTAQRVLDPEVIKFAARLYVDKYASGEVYYDIISNKNEDHAIYAITPKMFAIFDNSEKPTVQTIEI